MFEAGAQRPVFSRRLPALANANAIGGGTDSKTQKSPDLARRKAVGCMGLFGGAAVWSLHYPGYLSLSDRLCW